MECRACQFGRHQERVCAALARLALVRLRVEGSRAANDTRRLPPSLPSPLPPPLPHSLPPSLPPSTSPPLPSNRPSPPPPPTPPPPPPPHITITRECRLSDHCSVDADKASYPLHHHYHRRSIDAHKAGPAWHRVGSLFAARIRAVRLRGLVWQPRAVLDRVVRPPLRPIHPYQYRPCAHRFISVPCAHRFLIALSVRPCGLDSTPSLLAPTIRLVRQLSAE